MRNGDYREVLQARRHMRAFFEAQFFANDHKYLMANVRVNATNPPTPQDSRRVFLCFMRSCPIIMRRFMDAAKRFTVDLSNVVIVALPWKDTITNASSAANIERARAAGMTHANRDTVTVQAYLDMFRRIARVIVGCRVDPLVTSGKVVWCAPTSTAAVRSAGGGGVAPAPTSGSPSGVVVGGGGGSCGGGVSASGPPASAPPPSSAPPGSSADDGNPSAACAAPLTAAASGVSAPGTVPVTHYASRQAHTPLPTATVDVATPTPPQASHAVKEASEPPKAPPPVLRVARLHSGNPSGL